jgi:proteasome lid subunit RPN8/RPN11
MVFLAPAVLESKQRLVGNILQRGNEAPQASAMIEITISAADITGLQKALLGADVEHCAVLYASQTTQDGGRIRLLIRDIDLPVASDYESQLLGGAVLRPNYVARVSKRAKREGLSLIFVHSHPGSSAPRFSVTDDEGEQHLAYFLSHRSPDRVHAALVMSRGGLRARQLGTGAAIKVVVLGACRSIPFDPERPGGDVERAGRTI